MLSVIFQYIKKMPHFLYLLAVDLVRYIRDRRWEWFEGWGLHLYVGSFGAGKTCSMVQSAYLLAKRYKQLTIVTNFKLNNFPAHTRILPLRSPQDIINSPDDTLILIDEIGTIFNSRDFASSKQSVPKILFQHICQCRKRHKMIFATTQRWNFLDKQLRDITATVKVTRTHFPHPWSRICTVWTFDAQEYDLAFTNPMYPLHALYGGVYVQTDACRARYDTEELIENMMNAEYITDEEIAANRGDVVQVVGAAPDRKGDRRIRHNTRMKA